MTEHLPDGSTLAFGVATAAYQIEGASTEDGRGPSVWDTFAAKPGATRDGRDGSVACDSYHRFEEDLDLVAGMNAGWYRFSVAWPRIIPAGTGGSRPAGWTTTTVWSTPRSRAACSRLPRSTTGTCPRRSRTAEAGWSAAPPRRSPTTRWSSTTVWATGCKVWATHNEPWCAAYLGYSAGIHAPGRKEGAAGHRAAHHLNLAHGLAAARLHEAGVRDVGIVHNLAPFWPETPEAAPAADELDAVRNRIWTGPLVDGAYDEELLRVAPVLTDAALVRDGDLALVHGSADWLGVNYYTPFRPTLADPDLEVHPEVEAYPGVRRCPSWSVSRAPTSAGRSTATGSSSSSSTPTSAPACRSWSPRTARRTPTTSSWREPPATWSTTRTGSATSATTSPPRGARAAGADVRGYIVWTLLDNFEWAEGYTKTFGVVHVDPRGPHPHAQGVLPLAERAHRLRFVLTAGGRRSALDAAGHQAPHEVALQGQEDDQRHDERDEGARGEQVPVLPAGARTARRGGP